MNTLLQSGTPADVLSPRVDPVRPQQILLVDDEPLLARLGGQFLRKLGYEAVTETDANAALALFRAGSFDLVITDLTMPSLSGIQFGREVLALRPTQPILLVTAFYSEAEGTMARSVGIREVLMKPYDLAALRAAILRVLPCVTVK